MRLRTGIQVERWVVLGGIHGAAHNLDGLDRCEWRNVCNEALLCIVRCVTLHLETTAIVGWSDAYPASNELHAVNAKAIPCTLVCYCLLAITVRGESCSIQAALEHLRTGERETFNWVNWGVATFITAFFTTTFFTTTFGAAVDGVYVCLSLAYGLWGIALVVYYLAVYYHFVTNFDLVKRCKLDVTRSIYLECHERLRALHDIYHCKCVVAVGVDGGLRRRNSLHLSLYIYRLVRLHVRTEGCGILHGCCHVERRFERAVSHWLGTWHFLCLRILAIFLVSKARP